MMETQVAVCLILKKIIDYATNKNKKNKLEYKVILKIKI